MWHILYIAAPFTDKQVKKPDEQAIGVKQGFIYK